MITVVNPEERIAIPDELVRRLGIQPGYRLDWRAVEGSDEILVRILPNRGALARQLLGAGRKYAPERDAVADLIEERANEA